MKILTIATHPDDEVLGCGGVMARHASEGDEVHVLVVSRGIPEIFPPSEIEGTRVELKKAHRILGVADTRFLDFPAPKLDTIPSHEIADRIGDAINSIKPTTVYLPHGGDLHADHRAVFHATLVSCRPMNACPARRLLCYETLSETEWAPPFPGEVFIPNVFVNIDDFLETKIKALSCYVSQLKVPPHPRSIESAEALARLRGSASGLHAAEAFVLVRDIWV